jgi:hypothetical protein
MKKPTNSAWQTASLVPSALPLACCLETKVAVTGQQNDELAKSEEDEGIG